MKIRRFSLLEGASKAKGTTVVIDVFRAFTTAAYAFDNGVEMIYPVSSIDEAFDLKRKNPDWVLMGEREGKQIQGFDYGNSPYEISKAKLHGKKIIQTTSAGTQGIALAKDASEVLPGSFVISDAIVRYILENDPDEVSLIGMGWGGRVKSVEDEACADYIEKKLKGEEPDFEKMRKRIRSNPEGAKFFDPAQPQFREEDYHYAMDLNKFSFCMKVEKEELPFIIKI
jgi:2-phosphosulfolactate phosphatase